MMVDGAMNVTSPTATQSSHEPWAALDILRVFLVAYSATTTKNGAAAMPMEQVSTSEVTSAVQRSLYGADVALCPPSSAPPPTAASVAHQFLESTRGVTEVHARLVRWLSTCPPPSADLGPLEKEERFLLHAATAVGTLGPLDHPQAVSCMSGDRLCKDSPLSVSYAQLLHSNLYTVNCYLDATDSAEELPETTGSPTEDASAVSVCRMAEAAESLLLYLVVAIVDLAEVSMRWCGEALSSPPLGRAGCCTPTATHSSAAPSVSQHLTSPSRSFTMPLSAVLRTHLQEEGSQLVARLLQLRKMHQRRYLRCSMPGALDPTYQRVLIRHLLRRLGPLFFHPLIFTFPSAEEGGAVQGEAQVVSDRTAIDVVSWMAAELDGARRHCDDANGGDARAPTSFGSFRTEDKEETVHDTTEELFRQYCLMWLLHLLTIQLCIDQSDGVCPRGDGGAVDHTVLKSFGVHGRASLLSRLPEYALLLLPAIDAAIQTTAEDHLCSGTSPAIPVRRNAIRLAELRTTMAHFL